MDVHCFPVDLAQRHGAADNGSIAVIEPGAECCRLATRDHASADGSTRRFAAYQQVDDAIRARDYAKYDHGSAHDDG
jgi:hypothetical protein